MFVRVNLSMIVVYQLFLSAWWIKLRLICGMKMLCFKAFGNRFKEALEPLNAAKSKVLSTSNLRRCGTVRKVGHMWPNLVLENLTFANHVDLVGPYIQAEKYKLSPDFRQLILALFDKLLDVGPYIFLRDLTQNAYVEFSFIKSI